MDKRTLQMGEPPHGARPGRGVMDSTAWVDSPRAVPLWGGESHTGGPGFVTPAINALTKQYHHQH